MLSAYTHISDLMLPMPICFTVPFSILSGTQRTEDDAKAENGDIVQLLKEHMPVVEVAV